MSRASRERQIERAAELRAVVVRTVLGLFTDEQRLLVSKIVDSLTPEQIDRVNRAMLAAFGTRVSMAFAEMLIATIDVTRPELRAAEAAAEASDPIEPQPFLRVVQ